MTTATAPAKKAPVIVSMLGGQYDAECGPDGKYSIKDIEFFSTHQKGENGVDFNVTDEKIREMYAALTRDAKSGHLIPVNVFHHGDPQHPDVRQIAYFMPRSLKNAFVNGRDRLTIFGDIVGISSYDFSAMRDVKYPYRSPEVLSFKDNRFRALALLKDQIGYYNYPMLTVGSVTFSGSAPSLPEVNDSPLMAYRAGANSDNLLFCYAFGANDKKKSKKPDDKKKSGEGDSKSKKSDKGDGDAPPFGKDKEDGDSAEGGDGEFNGEGEEETQESPTDGMSTEEKIDQILAIVTQLQKDSCPSENDVNGDKAPSQDVATKKPSYSAKKEEAVNDKKEEKKEGAPASESKPETKADAKSQIEADAKYAALEDRQAKLEHKITSRENAEKAVAALEAEGYRLTKSTKEKIAHYSAKGEEQLAIYVDTYKAHAEKDPPDENAAPTGSEKTESVAAPKIEGLPEEIASYAAKNPGDKAGIELRKRLLPEYEEHRAMGGTIPTFERFVEVEVKSMSMMGTPKE